MSCLAKTEKKDFKCVFYSYIKNCQLLFSHNFKVLSLINYYDDETVFSYFIPRHQTLKFHIILKLKGTL